MDAREKNGERLAAYLRDLAKAVRHGREGSGCSQERLSSLSGLDRAYVGALERGTKNATLGTLMAILEGLEKQPVEILGSIRLIPDALVEQRAAGEACIVKPELRPGASYSEMFGAALQYERKRKAFTQEEFAHHIHKGRSYMNRLEGGKVNPTFLVIMQVLEGLQMQPAEFFEHIKLHSRRRVKSMRTKAMESEGRKSTLRALSAARPRSKGSP